MSNIIKTVEIFNNTVGITRCSIAYSPYVLCNQIYVILCEQCIMFTNSTGGNSDSITQLIEDYEQDN